MKNDSLSGSLKGRVASIAGDFVVHILAFLIYTVARQIIVFPVLAHHLADDVYGMLLTVVGFANVCTALIGGSLNNIRLIRDAQYQEKGELGDFQILGAVGSGVSVVVAAVLWAVFRLHALTALLLALYLVVSNYYQYATAFYRLKLDFKRNLIAYSISAGVYVLAAFCLATPLLWPAVFLLGEGAGLAYCIVTTKFHREPFRRTALMAATAKDFVGYMMTNLVGNLLTYADRFIVFAAMSAASVSYYSTASFFGKSAALVMTPVASVLLGYFAQKNFKPSKKLFALINGISLACIAAFLLVSQVLAPWVTKLLYPTLFQQSAPYIFLANLGAMLGIAAVMAQPMILKSCSIKWVLAIQILYGAVYLAAALWLLPLYGLYGFCWATILSGAVRMLALYILGFLKLP
ncbi:MAG: hypothetical protein E7429_00370 [Ruminococcaceae bacterium]|nr:hypothetical protein [Oscillospiraceae bacterium]